MPKPELNIPKYSNAILFFIKYCNNRYLGDTKLNKLFYYLDFISYRDKKESVTGDFYIHKDYGPVPENIDLVLSDLKEKGSILADIIPYKDCFKTEFKAMIEPDMSVFDEYEKKLLYRICEKFEMWTTDKIVEQTHLEAPWFYSKPYEEVDYSYAKDIDFF